MWSPRRFNARDHEGVHRESTERTRSNRRVDGVNRLGAALVGAAPTDALQATAAGGAVGIGAE